VSGSGSAAIDGSAVLEFTGAASCSVAFHGTTGELILDHSVGFTGTIYGFAGDGTLTNSDLIDLRDINFSSFEQCSYDNGVLTVSDGIHTATLDFSGNYELANFKFADDGHGGTLVYDPPVTCDTTLANDDSSICVTTNAAATTTTGTTSTDDSSICASTNTAATTTTGTTSTDDSSICASTNTVATTSTATTLTDDSTNCAPADQGPTGPGSSDCATFLKNTIAEFRSDLDKIAQTFSDQIKQILDGTHDTNGSGSVLTEIKNDLTGLQNATKQLIDNTVCKANPILSGQLANDSFTFASNFGHDNLSNFKPGSDTVHIDQTFVQEVHQLLDAAHDAGANAVLGADAGALLHDTLKHTGDLHFA
jgi:hypothetical protein